MLRAVPGPSDVAPLDEAAQEAVVAELRQRAADQERLWRRVFGVLGVVLASLLAASSLYQLTYPWQGLHAALYPHVPSRAVAAADALSACVIAASSHTLLSSSPRSRARRLHVLSALGCLVALFFVLCLTALHKSQPSQAVALFWLPFPPLFPEVANFVLRSTGAISNSLHNLEASRYEFKEI